MSLSSGTFNSLSQAAYSNFADASKIGNLNLQIQEDDINSKISAARQNLSSQHWGDFFGAIGNVANIALIGAGGLGSSAAKTAGSTASGAAQDVNKTWSQGASATNWWDRHENQWQNQG